MTIIVLTPNALNACALVAKLHVVTCGLYCINTSLKIITVSFYLLGLLWWIRISLIQISYVIPQFLILGPLYFSELAVVVTLLQNYLC
jgi:hypothetical protein